MFLLQEILPRAEKIKVRLKEKFQKEYDEFVAEQVRRKLKITFFSLFFLYVEVVLGKWLLISVEINGKEVEARTRRKTESGERKSKGICATQGRN